MNEKFFELPEEKQRRIINAGFRIFAANSYKKSPVGEIAAEAGISKSLLFHYFHNKKELYLFLWEKCAQLTKEALEKAGCYEPADMFDAMLLGLQTKLQIMRNYPDIARFAIRAYYEKDPEIVREIAEYLRVSAAFQPSGSEKWFRSDRFRPGLDLGMMYREIFLASEGFIWEKLQADTLNVDAIEAEYIRLIQFWRKVYLKDESN